jgi:hypothetical protein
LKFLVRKEEDINQVATVPVELVEEADMPQEK